MKFCSTLFASLNIVKKRGGQIFDRLFYYYFVKKYYRSP